MAWLELAQCKIWSWDLKIRKKLKNKDLNFYGGNILFYGSERLNFCSNFDSKNLLPPNG